MIVAVFLVDQYAGHLLDNGAHFLLMGVVVIASAWFAGTGAALGTTIVAAVLGAVRVSTWDETGFTHLALFIVNAYIDRWLLKARNTKGSDENIVVTKPDLRRALLQMLKKLEH